MVILPDHLMKDRLMAVLTSNRSGSRSIGERLVNMMLWITCGSAMACGRKRVRQNFHALHQMLILYRYSDRCNFRELDLGEL